MENVKFSEEFFEGEYREGFFVESMMKRAWAAQIEVLREIDSICNRHEISYFADWGTLLGAVRHQGFIPWDDDMDIAMKRADLQKFLTVAKRELPEEYRVLNVNTEEKYDQIFTRVVNRDAISIQEEELKKFHGCPYVVGVDIFTLDCLPRNEEEEEVQCELVSTLLMLADLCDKKVAGVEKQIRNIEAICGVKFEQNSNLKNQILRLIDQICQLYEDEDAHDLTLIPYYIEKREFRLKKEWYEESVLLPYENIRVPVPKYYDEVLKAMYGDYHKFVHNLQDHEYPFYKQQQEILDRFMEGKI